MQPYYLTEKDLESKYGKYGIIHKEELIKYVDIMFDHGRASLVIRLYNMCCYSAGRRIVGRYQWRQCN